MRDDIMAKTEIKVGKMTKCVSCDTEILEESAYHSDTDGSPVCETCYQEADPIATVMRNGDRNDVEHITEYCNNTPFTIGYHRSDGWRGYYEVTKSADWVNVHDDCYLSMSEDSEDLESFYNKFKDYCSDNDIDFYTVSCRSSNLFSSGFDLFVKTENVAEIKGFIENLKNKGMRNAYKFQSEALTGVPASRQTDKDKQAALAMSMVMGGASAEDAVKTVKTLEKLQNIVKNGKKPKKK